MKSVRVIFLAGSAQEKHCLKAVSQLWIPLINFLKIISTSLKKHWENHPNWEKQIKFTLLAESWGVRWIRITEESLPLKKG